MQDGDLLRDYADHKSDAAFTQVVERYLNFVYSACRRMLGDAQLAEDATQIVFLSLAKHAPALRGKTSVGGWLYTAARFTCGNLRRQEMRRRSYEEQAGREMMNAGSTEDDWSEIAPLLEDAMQSLRPPEREALILRFFQGCSLQETGEALGVSEEAARKRMGRALDKLRAYFVRHGVAMSVAAMTAVIADRAVEASPITALVVVHSVKAASIAGVAGSSIAMGSEGVLRMMWITRAKTAGAIATVLIGGLAAIAGAHELQKRALTASARTVMPSVPPGAQTVKLADGIAVSLLAVCPNLNGSGEQWWNADGKWLTDIPSLNNGFRTVQYETSTAGRPLSLLLSITGPDRYYVGSVGYVVDPDGQLDKQGYLVKGAPIDGGWISKNEASTSLMRVGLPPDTKTFDYWFGLATGRWETAVVTKYAAPRAGEIFHTKNRFGHSVVVTLSDRPTVGYQDLKKTWHTQSLLGASPPLGAVDRWVTAVDAQGHDVHFGFPEVDKHGLRTVMMQPEDLAKIAEFRLQTRPYVWAEFKNVPAQATMPARPQVLIDTPAPLPRYTHMFQSGVGIQLTAVHRFIAEGGEWWRPDGQTLPGAVRGYDQTANGIEVDAHPRIIAYTLTGPATATCNIVWKSTRADRVTIPMPSLEEKVHRSHADGDYGLNYYSQYHDNSVKTDVKVGLAGGPWKTVVAKDVDFTPEKLAHRDIDPQRDNDGDVSPKIGPDIRIDFKDANGRLHDDLLLAKTDFNAWAYRLVAVMTDGTQTPLTANGDRCVVNDWYKTYNLAFDPKSNLWSYNKDVDLSKIRQIRVQTRPYEWTEIPGVVLKPGE